MKQAIVIHKCSFYDCLSPTATVIERQQREYDTVEFFSWLKHMSNQMNQPEDHGVGVFVCVMCKSNEQPRYYAVTKTNLKNHDVKRKHLTTHCAMC